MQSKTTLPTQDEVARSATHSTHKQSKTPLPTQDEVAQLYINNFIYTE